MNNNIIIDKIKIYSKIEADNKFYDRKIRKYIRKHGYKLHIKIKNNKIWITFCPCKFKNNTENNLLGVTHLEFIGIIRKLEGILKDIENLLHIKICSKINEFKISRIDLTVNIVTKYPFPTYIPMYESIRPKYQLIMGKIRNTNNFAVIEYPSTVIFKSKDGKNSFTIMIYDKNKQLQDEGIPLIEEYSDLNIMRFELVFNNATLVKEKLKISTVSDILKDIDFINLNKTRLEIIHNYLFHEMLNTEANTVNKLNDIEIANKISDKHKRNKLDLIALIVSSDDIDYKWLNDLYLKNDVSQKHANKRLDIIRKYKRQYANKKGKLSVSGLYREIYTKLFGTEEIKTSA